MKNYRARVSYAVDVMVRDGSEYEDTLIKVIAENATHKATLDEKYAARVVAKDVSVEEADGNHNQQKEGYIAGRHSAIEEVCEYIRKNPITGISPEAYIWNLRKALEHNHEHHESDYRW